MDNIGVLISEEEVESKITEIAKQIENDYKGKELTIICILKGSVFFTTSLAKKITGDVRLEFIKVASYDNTTSTGEIKLQLDLKDSIKGKDVVVIEDIIDTGRTLSYLINFLKAKEPNSVKLCTLLDKPSRRVVDVKVDYVGFQIPDKFVVGYGLDFNQKYRNLPYIGVIE